MKGETEMTVTGQQGSMQVQIDSDVLAVMEFMQARIPTDKLVAVAEGVRKLAGPMWDGYPQQTCQTLALVLPKTDLQRPLRSDAI